MHSLRAVKLIHTIIWAFFVGCILAIPVLSWFSLFRPAVTFVAVVAVEVAVLVLNGLSCPLTKIAARYTSDRRANFDIYLPEWLARHNKAIFGSLYFGGVLFLLERWLAS